MSGGSAATPRAGCAMSATSRLGSSEPYARHATPVSPLLVTIRPDVRPYDRLTRVLLSCGGKVVNRNQIDCAPVALSLDKVTVEQGLHPV